jgi:hypothetical protein
VLFHHQTVKTIKGKGAFEERIHEKQDKQAFVFLVIYYQIGRFS